MIEESVDEEGKAIMGCNWKLEVNLPCFFLFF